MGVVLTCLPSSSFDKLRMKLTVKGLEKSSSIPHSKPVDLGLQVLDKAA